MMKRLITTFAILILGVSAFAQGKPNQPKPSPQKQSPPKTLASVLYSKWSPSVVWVQTVQSDEGGTQGTGFVFGGPDVVATCYHLLDGAKAIEVVVGHKKLKPPRIACDKSRDLALLFFDEPLKKPVFQAA